MVMAPAFANSWDAEKENRKKIRDPWVKDFMDRWQTAHKKNMPQDRRPKGQALDPEFDDSVSTKKSLKECMKPGNVIDDQVFQCMKGDRFFLNRSVALKAG
jgi:hypothetical protein